MTYNYVAPHIKDQNLYDLAVLAGTVSGETATQKALAHSVSIEGVLTDSVPECFGMAWADSISRTRRNFLDDNGANADDVMILALRFFEYAKWSSWGFIDYLFSHAPNPIPHDYPGGPDEYAEKEGWIDALHAHIGDLNKPYDLLGGLCLDGFPRDWEIARALSIAWFFEAAKLKANDDKRAFDVLCWSSEAESLYSSYRMFEDGQKNAPGENPASVMAKRRHAENYALKDEAMRYYRGNIDPSLSAARAANDLTRIVPVSHKKLAEWVSEEKRKML